MGFFVKLLLLSTAASMVKPEKPLYLLKTPC